MHKFILLGVICAFHAKCLVTGNSPVEIKLPDGTLYLDIHVTNYTKTPQQPRILKKAHEWTHVGMFPMDKSYFIDYFHSTSWKKNYSICDGHRQSPININPRRFQLFNERVWRNFDKQPKEMMIINNGNTAQLIGNWENTPYLQGQASLPYRGKYAFSDVTFHWSKFGKGSEHLLKGIRYSMEMQLVFYKQEGNTDVMEAISHDDHIAIISVLYQLSENDNERITDLIEGFKKVTSPRTMTSVAPFPLRNLLPNNKNYFEYPGSITIPPCTETVTWIVMSHPNNISEPQLQTLRALVGNDNKVIISNVRTLSKHIY